VIGDGQNARVLARVLKVVALKFSNVFECSRVLDLAINAREIICSNHLIALSRQRSASIILGLCGHRATERDN
jgi:hypothetical protein